MEDHQDSPLKRHAEGGADVGEENHESSKINGGSQKLTKEQLMDYVKKQKMKIKQLENKIQELQSQPPDTSVGIFAPSKSTEGSGSESPDQGGQRSETEKLQKLKLALKLKLQDIESYKELTGAKEKEIEILQEDLNQFRENENSVIKELLAMISERTIDEEQLEYLRKNQHSLSSFSLLKTFKDLLHVPQPPNDSTSIGSLQTLRTADTLTWLDTHDHLDSRFKEEIKHKVKMKFLELSKKHQREVEEKEEEYRNQLSQMESSCELKILELTKNMERVQLEYEDMVSSSPLRIQEFDQLLLSKSEEIATLNSLLGEVRLQNDSLAAEVTDLTERLHQSSQIDDSELRSLRTSIAALTSQFQEREAYLRNEAATEQQEKEQLKSLVSLKDQEIFEVSNAMEEILNEKNLRENLERELNELIDKNQLQHDAAIRNSELEMEEMRRKFEEDFKEMNDLCSERERELHHRGEEIETLQVSLRTLEGAQVEEREKSRSLQSLLEESKLILEEKEERIGSLTEEVEALHATLSDLKSQLQDACLDRDQSSREIELKDTSAEEHQATPEPAPQMTASAKRAAKKKAKKANKAQTASPVTSASAPPPAPSVTDDPASLEPGALLESENLDLRDQLTCAQSLNSEYRSLIAQFEQKLQGHESERNSTQYQLSALRSESEANLLKLSLQQQQIADYQTRVEELENQLTIEMNNEQSVVERELNKWEEVNVKYQDALREWDVLREEYQSKESEYLDEIDALRTQLNEFTSMAQEESAAKDGTISKLRLEIQELCLQIEKLEKDNGNLSAALSETDQRYQEFEHLLQSQESQMEALRSQLSESTLIGQEEGTVKDKVIDDLRLEVEKLQKDNASLSAALSETGQRTSEFEQSIESQETEMSSLLQQISEMKLRKGQLQDSFAEIMTKYESEAAEKLEISQKYETEIDELKQRLCVAEETISQLEESQRAVPQEKPSQAEGPSGDFSEGTPSDIEERFRKEIGESESGQVYESSLRRESEESELQQMSALLEKQNKDLTDELSDLREHVRTVEAERNECVSLQQRISALEREKDSLEADREFVERNSEERLLALERDFEGKVATMRAELEQSISHFNEEKSRMESESEETRCQREEAHIEEKRALEEQLQSWKLQCDANEQLVSELKAEVSSIKEQMKTQQDSKKGVEQKLKKFAIELKNKHSALTESQGEVKKLQASVAQREEELRQLKDESGLHHRQQEERIAEVEAASLKKYRAEKSKLEAALAEASRSREEVSILQAQLDENRKLLEEYEAQSSAGKDWKQAAELKLKKYAMELKTRGATVKDLTEGLSQSKELVATLQHQLQEANLLKSQQAENLHRLSGECEAAQLRSCHLESEIASLQYQLEGTRREVSHERDEFQQQFDDLVEWKKVNEVKLKKYAVELRSRQEIIRDLKSQQEEWVRQRDSLENEVARLDKANQDLISSDELETKFQRLKDENLRLQKLVGDSQKNLPSPVLPPSPPPALASESVLAELTEEREGRKVAEAKVKKYALELRGKLATVKELKGEMERANSEVERLKGEAATKDQELRQAQQQAEEISKDRDASREELDRLTAALRKLEEQHKQKIAESEAQFQRQLIKLRQIDESQRSSEREHLLLQLSGFEERNSQLQSEIDSLRTQITQSDSQILSLNEELLSVSDQVKRLKTLLAKSRDLLQEREEETTRAMQEALLPWKVCQIEYCVEGGEALLNRQSSGLKWYLLSTELAHSERTPFAPHIHHFPETQKYYRWVEGAVLSDWLEKQSTSITPSPGYLAIAASANLPAPSSEQVTWFSLESVSQSSEERLSQQLKVLLGENRRLASEAESLTQQFHTYKLRAQSALKRIGKDEQMERYKQMEEEDNLWGELRAKVQELEQVVETKDAELRQLVSQGEELRQAAKEKANKALEFEEKLRLSEMRFSDGKLELKRMEDRSSSLEEMVRQLELERNDLSERLAELSRGKNPHSHPKRVEEEKNSPLPAENLVGDSDDEAAAPVRSSRPSQPLPLFSPSSVEESDDHQVYLAHIQAAVTLQEMVTQLKRELSDAVMEKSELQNTVSLNDDQISVLKLTIRDLEATLGRERELNSSNRTLNTEYLVNVLKSFLLTKNVSEQSKLVPVLCSILHFQSEETKEICQVWSKKVPSSSSGVGGGSGGLMGWFLPPSSSSSGEQQNLSREQYTDGIGGLDIY